MRITLKQLMVFEAVARSGQVAKASLLINLSAPATSMALSELEKQLNTRLFERIGNRLHLNAQGRLLLPLVTQSLQGINDIEQLFTQNNNPLSGALNISASSTIGNYLLAKSAVAFCQQHTAASVDVDIDNTRHVIDSVLHFRSEVGFIEGECIDSRLQVEAWHKDRLLVFCHPAHPLAEKEVDAKQISLMPWVMREEGSGTREYFMNAAHQLNIQPIEKFRFSSSDAVKQAVKQGGGLGVLSELTLEKELARKDFGVIHVENLQLERQFYRIKHKDCHFTPLAQGFMTFCDDFLHL
ncbi:LysR substrate-binding domain-containing protein [Shewanella surugensis]|uniref:LysR substrate-binding domain-containing protein n=1 Tax=Shewanella surugensis TaxID=212020 RepID=A0ABT0LBT7_9GAMM|nr:LysR substrate-binding domain-containing protein [Shewanella surugensis]MCL1125138.1 LysR substrate-binding domain-containing protein [Shewanella surugensis]